MDDNNMNLKIISELLKRNRIVPDLAAKNFLREGFDDYLSKLIDVAALESILKRHLPAVELTTLQVDESAADTFSATDRKIFADACPQSARKI
ncbi:MAG: hypothetical protein SR1Q7_10945 [Quinella sp. 1Q7]|nr:hypothetical protein [Quinella sp. 1Q7]